MLMIVSLVWQCGQHVSRHITVNAPLGFVKVPSVSTLRFTCHSFSKPGELWRSGWRCDTCVAWDRDDGDRIDQFSKQRSYDICAWQKSHEKPTHIDTLKILNAGLLVLIGFIAELPRFWIALQACWNVWNSVISNTFILCSFCSFCTFQVHKGTLCKFHEIDQNCTCSLVRAFPEVILLSSERNLSFSGVILHAVPRNLGMAHK